MADVQNAATPAATATAKAKTVIDDMTSRRIFDTKEAAIAYIMESYAKFADMGNYPVVSPFDAETQTTGLNQDTDGNLVFNPTIFPDDMRVMVAVLTQKISGDKSSVKAIVVTPVPSFDAIMSSEAGKAWLTKIVDTEVNRIAVRVLRPVDANVEDVTLLDQLPKTLDDFVVSNRGGSSTLLEAFEELWKPIKTALGKLSRAWKLQNLSKREFKNAMSSKAYASQYYPTLEDTKAGSLFEMALKAFIQEAPKTGKDTAIFNQWLANRDTYKIEAEDEDGDEDSLSLDALTAAMTSEDATDETPVVDAAA